MITDKQLDAFIQIYKEQFGEVLNRQEAYEQAMKLINFVKLTCFESNSITIIACDKITK